MTFFDTFFQKSENFEEIHQIDENTKAHTLFIFLIFVYFVVLIFSPKLTHFLSVHDRAKTHVI